MKSLARRMNTDPVPVIRQTRKIPVKIGTTLKPGVITPVGAFPLLRMDSSVGAIDVVAELAETYELLYNKVEFRLHAFFVPHVAMKRFEKNPTFFNKSFAGEVPMEGKPVIPYIETAPMPAAGSSAVYKYLGVGGATGALKNTSYLEAYNQVVNWIKRNRSNDLALRSMDDHTLAPSMWGEHSLSEIVPDFDDAMIAGEVPLTVVSGKLPISGLAVNKTGKAFGTAASTLNSVSGGGPADAGAYNYAGDGNNGLYYKGTVGTAAAQVYAEMAQNGITVSLANIEQAKALVSWAKLREQYEGHPEEYVIDILMSGIEIEDQEWFQPMLLDTFHGQFVQGLRHATDGASLLEKATNGLARGRVSVNVPANPYGGVIMVLAEALPEQLYERQGDPWFDAASVDDLPNYFQDVTNPMPVVEVKNKEVDYQHATPNGLFGYARRNWRWLKWPARIGGDMHAQLSGETSTEARRKIWPTTKANPALAADFYEVQGLPLTPFWEQNKDQVEIVGRGAISITGLTVIGAVHESEANYEAVREKAKPLQPIVKP